MRRVWFTVLAALSLAACNNDVASPPPPDLRLLPDAQSSDSWGLSFIDLATGGGKIALGIAGFSDVDFAFAALRIGNHGAKGFLFQSRTEPSGKVEFRGEVTCLSIDPVNHRAWIAGIITRNRSTHPSFLTAIHQPGRDVWFRTVDYGEGSNSPDDRSTVLGFQGSAGIITSAEYCATKPWPDLDARTFPVSKGNVQVH